MFTVVFMMLVSLAVAGCSNQVTNVQAVRDTIEVQERVGDKDDYEVIRVITDSSEVKQGKELVESLGWEDAKVSMVRPADFRFSFPIPEAKVVLYELWISPDKDTVELVIHAENKYVKLDESLSAELFELLTGDSLSDVE